MITEVRAYVPYMLGRVALLTHTTSKTKPLLHMSRTLLLAFTSITYVFHAFGDQVYDDQVKNQWFKDGIDLTKKNFHLKPNTKPAKNVILFIGDGMGISTTTAARIFDGQNKRQLGEENVLSWEEFPYTALSKTYNTDAQIPDSAGTATAFACGVKTGEGILGLNEKAIYKNCSSSKGNEVLSILTFAEIAGLSTGLITDTRVTHATPGAFYSHTPSRNWENDQSTKGDCKDIAKQLIEYPYGDGLDVVLGGGRQAFLPCGSYDAEGKFLNNSKCRQDGRNLTKEWESENNSEYVWNREQLKNVDADKVNHLLGLFSYSGMSFAVKREQENRTGEPSLEEMVEKSIRILQKNPKGFFLMVEGGLIDWGHHAGKAHIALSQTVEFDKAIRKAQELTKPEETLMIVTADHSHSFVLYGYAKRGNPIFGFQSKDGLDGKPSLTLSYADGIGGLDVNESRADLTGMAYNDPDFMQQALVKSVYESHAGEDVGIYATGPFAHLLRGVVEQSYIFHVMDYALCLTESKQGFCTKPVSRGGPSSKSSSKKHISFFLSFSFAILSLCYNF